VRVELQVQFLDKYIDDLTVLLLTMTVSFYKLVEASLAMPAWHCQGLKDQRGVQELQDPGARMHVHSHHDLGPCSSKHSAVHSLHCTAPGPHCPALNSLSHCPALLVSVARAQLSAVELVCPAAFPLPPESERGREGRRLREEEEGGGRKASQHVQLSVPRQIALWRKCRGGAPEESQGRRGGGGEEGGTI